MAVSFSRKPAYAAAAPASGAPDDLRAKLMAAISNPYISASGAACLFLASLAALVLITSDPKAGAPLIRLELTKIGATKNAPEGWREALSGDPAHEASLVPGELGLSASPFGPVMAKTQDEAPIAEGLENAPAIPQGPGLPQAPMAGLSAPGPGGGLLPIIAADGRTVADAYARPFTPDGRPKVSVVIGGLGLNAQTTRAAIETLPGEITLSFAPYAEGLQGWIDLARAHGHEVLLETPMEPADYPANDPGPYTLIATNRPDDTVRKLEWLMSRATGYFGLSNYLGARFVDNDQAMNTFNAALKARGLAFIDDGLAARRAGPIPRASADRVIDDELSASAIDAQLRALETGAASRGQSLGSGFAYPVTINQVRTWAAGLQARGIQLAPASALAHR
ncbi:divergent polysaccharide deacetylase family protein [Caulobacter vibrioides]|uniref:Divergent polysaccharide deacetylase family protein n=1 Tax=Caulobacter vibrioides TaxID=155892 RepID=A0A290MP84_CAUVI|nr:divergent polysaccharide deacetylase family protein [Caulobacter vibrioides]ATC33896.1 divergent polysaccharide deacetylase family protein [Caulobacter vibrioides]